MKRDEGTAPTLFYIGYDQFLAHLETLAEAIASSGWAPDFLVGIGRGGLVPTAYLSHRTQVPMLSVDLSSGEIDFADALLVKLANKSANGERILIVDDINDSGATIASVRAAILGHGGDEDGIRVAVMIDNRRSQAKADFRASQIDRDTDKRWFVFPWESFASPETLIREAGEVPERLA